MPYCTITGLSKPYSLRSFGVARGIDAALAGHGLDGVARHEPDQEERQQRHPDEGRDHQAHTGQNESKHRR
jgi:hypothetical protein